MGDGGICSKWLKTMEGRDILKQKNCPLSFVTVPCSCKARSECYYTIFPFSVILGELLPSGH